jgi:hypothetical protein
MKCPILFVALVTILTSLPITAGCGGSEQTASPEKLEENRQQMMKRADRMRQEMNKK